MFFIGLIVGFVLGIVALLLWLVDKGWLPLLRGDE